MRALIINVKRTCFNYGRKDRYKRDCRFPKKEEKESPGPAQRTEVKLNLDVKKAMIIHTGDQNHNLILID